MSEIKQAIIKLTQAKEEISTFVGQRFNEHIEQALYDIDQVIQILIELEMRGEK